MATEIVVPRLGWSMEFGVFLGWLRAAGEPIEIGQPLFSLEGEKAVEEVAAVDRGVLWVGPDAPAEKTQVAVGQVIGYLLAVGEAPPAAAPRSAAPAGVQVASCESAAPLPAAPSVGPATPAAFNRPAASFAGDLAGSPSARRRARRAAASSASAVAASPAPATSAPAVNGQGRIRSTPRARRAAQQAGTPLQGLVGTGRGGRIRERDVLAAQGRGIAQGQSGRPIVAQLAEAAPAVSLLRQTIARRMHESLEQTAPVTLTTTADATELVRLRRQFQAAGNGAIPSYTDFFAKLVALALEQHPLLCQRRPEAPPLPPGVHLGIAVDTPGGLLVPVVRNVQRLALRQLAETSSTLIARARAGGLGSQDLQGACFTLTNLGAFGIEAFTPIINYPEAAILGLGRIRTEPVYMNDGKLEPRDRIALSLTFDHALLDGAPAARFLQTLCQYVATPAAVLL